MRVQRGSLGFWVLVITAVIPTVVLATYAHADSLVGVRTGVYTEAEAGFFGAEVVTPIAQTWYFNPNLEYAFVGVDRDVLSINGDFHYDFILDRPFYLWAGAGPAVIVREVVPGDRQTDLGVNLIGGMGWKKTNVEPYLQGKVAFSDDTEAVLAFGARF
jgi:hypothetical protein